MILKSWASMMKEICQLIAKIKCGSYKSLMRYELSSYPGLLLVLYYLHCI